MDWLIRMNSAINYIEDNITEKIDHARVAEIACCSVYHFQRMFSFIVEFPLSEYIRRRRLTLAAFELQNSDARVIDIAVKYGYDSADSFSRAFQKLHGVTPSLARDKGVTLKAYPKISFQISIKGDVEMNYRIEEKEAFEVFGVATDINSVDSKPYIEIPEFWGRCQNDGTEEKIHEIAGIDEEVCCHGALFNWREGKFSYMICYYTPENKEVPAEYTKLSVPKMTWAIFQTTESGIDHIGEQVQGIFKRLFSEWFPTSGYEHAEGPEFEMYYNKSGKDYNKYMAEVWIPVIKK